MNWISNFFSTLTVSINQMHGPRSVSQCRKFLSGLPWLKVYCRLYCARCFADLQNPFRLLPPIMCLCWNAEIWCRDWVNHFAVWPFCPPLVYSACSPRCDSTSEVLYTVHVPTATIVVPRPKCRADCSKPLGPPQDLSLHWSFFADLVEFNVMSSCSFRQENKQSDGFLNLSTSDIRKSESKHENETKLNPTKLGPIKYSF